MDLPTPICTLVVLLLGCSASGDAIGGEWELVDQWPVQPPRRPQATGTLAGVVLMFDGQQCRNSGSTEAAGISWLLNDLGHSTGETSAR